MGLFPHFDRLSANGMAPVHTSTSSVRTVEVSVHTLTSSVRTVEVSVYTSTGSVRTVWYPFTLRQARCERCGIRLHFDRLGANGRVSVHNSTSSVRTVEVSVHTSTGSVRTVWYPFTLRQARCERCGIRLHFDRLGANGRVSVHNSTSSVRTVEVSVYTSTGSVRTVGLRTVGRGLERICRQSGLT